MAAGATRISGIDVARALAIVGMVMVHIGPQDAGKPGIAAQAYRLSHGRASILFVVLAGIGVSLLAGDRSPQRRRSATQRLLWRAVVLLPIGLALQETGVAIAVILHFYAGYFLVATLLLRLSDRVLLGCMALSAGAGPVVYLWLHRVAPSWFSEDAPHWYQAGRILRDILLTGHYPLVTWTAPLAFGIWIGRHGLRSRRRAVWMLVGGAAIAALGFVVSNLLITRYGLAVGEADWRQLFMDEPHDNMPLWLLTSSATAMSVIAGCLLVADRLPRLSWPLVAFGQLAFTAYVLHALVLRWIPQWLMRETLDAAWVSTARFTLVSLVAATAYRAVARHGPFELLLRPPWLRQEPMPWSRGRRARRRDDYVPAGPPPAARDRMR